MKLPVLTSHDVKNSTPPILIVDKIGVIGQELAKHLSQDFLVVLLSPNSPEEKNEKIIHIPFKKKIPEVPDNRYSKIFLIDDGRTVTRQSAFSFISKAKESNSPLFFIGSIRNFDVAHADQIVSSYSNSRVLIFGDLFDKNIFFDRNVSISKFILQARKNGRIEVDGNGLSLSFPISFNDTIKLIIKASYLDIAQKVILLFSPHPITDISLANTFKKINPDVKVDFIKEKKQSEIYIPKGASHALSKYNVEQKIRELDLTDEENREVRIMNRKINKKNFLKPILAFLVLFLFVILLPFLTTSSYMILGERQINKARQSSEKGDFVKAKRQIENSKAFFEIALKTSEPLVMEGEILKMKSSAERIKSKAKAGQMISQASLYLLDGGERIRSIYKGESRDPEEDFSKASNSFKTSVSIMQKVKAEGGLPKDLEEELGSATPFIDLFSNSSDILPEVLGFDGPKKYLVLFQDNSELRPGGGVIESYGILEIKNAKITEFKTYDDSVVDKSLSTQIDPAFGLRRYLPLDNLTIRDSNFNPDFINSAISSSNIYSLATGEKVDGVIAIDNYFIKNLLLAIGPVTMEGQNKKISFENIDKLSNNQTEFNRKALDSIRKELEKSKNVSYFSLIKQVGISIKEKHLLFAFPKPSNQNIFTANGWSSSLWDNREKKNNKINDYLGISEANLGKNKANYFISRSVSKKIIVSGKGKISSEVIIAYRNNSSSGESYKNYFQLVLPEASKVNSIAIDGKSVKVDKAVTNPAVYGASGFEPPQGLEVEERNEMDKNIYGFLVQVPSSEIRTIKIIYDLPYSLPATQKSAEYSLKIYKQPGIDSYPFDLSFNLPENQRVLGLEKSFSKEIREDEDFEFTIAQR